MLCNCNSFTGSSSSSSNPRISLSSSSRRCSNNNTRCIQSRLLSTEHMGRMHTRASATSNKITLNKLVLTPQTLGMTTQWGRRKAVLKRMVTILGMTKPI